MSTVTDLLDEVQAKLSRQELREFQSLLNHRLDDDCDPEVLARLDKAREQIARGETQPAREMFADLRREIEALRPANG